MQCHAMLMLLVPEPMCPSSQSAHTTHLVSAHLLTHTCLYTNTLTPPPPTIPHCQVEHQRSLRQLAEDEAELTATQLQLQTERQAVAAAAGRQAIQEQAQAQAEK